ncbi:MAG: hypothetical protein VX444_13535 [Pseudomonadota bacterium]|nr:hypothetical protein [Pseudomonadota bacterium]
MNKTIFAVLAAISALSACAEYPKNITAAYIPSIVYKGASCYELNTERVRLEKHVLAIADQQKRTANLDTALVTSGTLLLPAAYLGLPFTRDQEAQLAVARGHYLALIEAGRNQGCGDMFTQANGSQYQYSTGKRRPGDFPPL